MKKCLIVLAAAVALSSCAPKPVFMVDPNNGNAISVCRARTAAAEAECVADLEKRGYVRSENWHP